MPLTTNPGDLPIGTGYSSGAPNSDMMYCKNCGATIPKKSKKCPYCKTKIRNSTGIGVWCIVIFLIVVVAGRNNNSSVQKNSRPASSKANHTSSVMESSAVTLFSEDISDEALRQDFLEACTQIEIKPEKIKNLEPAGDWVNGTIYSFDYEGMSFLCYCNIDSTVKSIKIGLDGENIYERGYEPYKVSDYIITSSMTSRLRNYSEEYIKAQLKFPAEAKFPLVDWSYGRKGDLYSVSSTVTTKNAFGVKAELPFSLTFKVNVEEKKATLLYAILDGEERLNKMDTIPSTERKSVEVEKKSIPLNEGEILLEFGELGEYGKTIDLDGDEHIDYHVPEGTYTVKNNGKWCKVFLDSDNYYRNSDGYWENDTIAVLEFTKNGEIKQLTVGSNEHIELTMYASVILIPQ